MKTARWLALLSLAALLTGCGSTLLRQDSSVAIWKPERPAPAVAASKGGGYYLNDGPGDNPPANLDAIPDAVPKVEPLKKATSRPYTVLGQTYTPLTSLKPYKETGVASWYGRRYHGQKTSTGEIYDMYAMTAAHTTLPLPSYVRVTNLKNNKSVVVRVNDRGPFHSDRLIDLSYTAAYKLGVLAGGSTSVLVESIDPANYSAAPVYAAAPKPAEAMPVVAQAQPLAAPIEAAASGHFVQVGAFGMQENAEHFRDRLKIELAQLSDKLQIYSADGLFRVRAGPYPSIAEASQIASAIKNSLNIKTVLTAH